MRRNAAPGLWTGMFKPWRHGHGLIARDIATGIILRQSWARRSQCNASRTVTDERRRRCGGREDYDHRMKTGVIHSVTTTRAVTMDSRSTRSGRQYEVAAEKDRIQEAVPLRRGCIVTRTAPITACLAAGAAPETLVVLPRSPFCQQIAQTLDKKMERGKRRNCIWFNRNFQGLLPAFRARH